MTFVVGAKRAARRVLSTCHFEEQIRLKPALYIGASGLTLIFFCPVV